MCTLTYLPTPDGGFALCSSRDETLQRGQAMSAPVFQQQDGALYPVDQRSGGTWIATTEAGYTLNILNGGLEAHQKQPPYRQSRGLVPLDFIRIGECHDFVDQFKFEGMEPFTLVVVHHEPRAICTIIWTGAEVLFDAHDPEQPHIWSSATLYDGGMRTMRQQWFQDALVQNPEPDFGTLYQFHQQGGNNVGHPEFALNMKRPNGQQTVCISGVEYAPNFWRFHYHDMVTGQERKISMVG